MKSIKKPFIGLSKEKEALLGNYVPNNFTGKLYLLFTHNGNNKYTLAATAKTYAELQKKRKVIVTDKDEKHSFQLRTDNIFTKIEEWGRECRKENHKVLELKNKIKAVRGMHELDTDSKQKLKKEFAEMIDKIVDDTIPVFVIPVEVNTQADLWRKYKLRIANQHHV